MARSIGMPEAVRYAAARGWALGQFNISNLETLQGVLAAAEAGGAPVIVGVSMGTLRHAGLGYVRGLMQAAREQSRVPLFFHLDHGADLKTLRQVLEAGFDSVMLDTSGLSFESNVAQVREAVALAHSHAAGAEAQVGETWDEESGAERNRLTDPRELEEFVAATGVDYVAVSFGNTPGRIEGVSAADPDLLLSLARRSPVPVVLHGGSSIADSVMRLAIRAGAAKVNIDTVLRQAVTAVFVDSYGAGLYSPDPRVQFRKAREAVAAAVAEKLRLFGAVGKARELLEAAGAGGRPAPGHRGSPGSQPSDGPRGAAPG